MKKILSILVAVVLFSAPLTSFAEDVQALAEAVSSMDSNSLWLLSILIRAECLSRSDEPFDVSAGVYRVGIDFPVGSYSFDMVSNGTEVCVYRNADSYNSEYPIPMFDQILNEYLGNTSIGCLSLEYGQILVIEGHVTAKQFVGLGY